MNILNKQTKIRLSLPPLEKFADEVLLELGLKPENLSIAFVSNPVSAHLNKTYRKIAKATDVLSFPAEADARLNRHRFLGDIAIAPAVAQRYAKKMAARSRAKFASSSFTEFSTSWDMITRRIGAE